MNESPVYQIRVNHHLDEKWNDWFSPMILVNEPDGEATLTGRVRDQAELQGLLDRVFELNLILLAVNRVTEHLGTSCGSTAVDGG